MIFPGFGVAASTGLIRKNGRGRIVGQQVHSTVSINTIYPNAFVYILFLVPIHIQYPSLPYLRNSTKLTRTFEDCGGVGGGPLQNAGGAGPIQKPPNKRALLPRRLNV